MIIDKPYIIDRETVKKLLQITDTTYDALIDLYLPLVSEDVQYICGQCFVKEYTGTLASGSPIIADIVLGNVYKGWLVSTSNYDNALIINADIDNYTLTVSEDSTATEETKVYINQFPIAKRIAVSQMVAFQLVKNNGVTTSTNGSVTSKSLPPLSVTYDTNDTSLTGGQGYPSYIVSALKSITKPRFI